MKFYLIKENDPEPKLINIKNDNEEFRKILCCDSLNFSKVRIDSFIYVVVSSDTSKMENKKVTIMNMENLKTQPAEIPEPFFCGNVLIGAWNAFESEDGELFDELSSTAIYFLQERLVTLSKKSDCYNDVMLIIDDNYYMPRF